jgi:hypothetical protein
MSRRTQTPPTDHVPLNACPPYTLNPTSLHLVTNTLNPTPTPSTQHCTRHPTLYSRHPTSTLTTLHRGWWGGGREEDLDADDGPRAQACTHNTSPWAPTCIHGAHTCTHNAHTRTHNAQTRTHNAQTRTHNAQTRTHNAQTRTHNAHTRTHNAHTRTHNAHTRTHNAHTRTHNAHTRTFMQMIVSKDANMCA